MNEMNREYLFDTVAVLMAGANQKESISDFLSPEGGMYTFISIDTYGMLHNAYYDKDRVVKYALRLRAA